MPQCSATNRYGAPCHRLVHVDGERCTYHRDFLSTPPRIHQHWYCAATNRSGNPCRRLVPAPGAFLCLPRRTCRPSDPSSSFATAPHPTDHLSPAEREALAQASLLPQPSSAIAILRILILHAAARCDLDSARRGMETLARLLKIQYALNREDPDEDPLEAALVAWAEALVADDPEAPSSLE